MARALILGGGFGGIAAAVRLRELLRRDDEIVLVDRHDRFSMGFHKNSIAAGREPATPPSHQLTQLERRGINVRLGSIERLLPQERAAVVDGERVDGAALLVALGADVDPSPVPGLREHGVNVYDRNGAARAWREVSKLERGRVLIGIFGAPYKCPPAPFELALLLRDALPPSVNLSLFSPLPMSLPVLGAAGCNPLEARMAEQGIEFRPNAKATSVEPGRVLLESGAMPYDVLLAVPPHRCPAVAVEGGLAQPGGWIKVDPRTLATNVEGVWAVGDATAIPLSNGQVLPKAGALAEQEGYVAAAHMAAHMHQTTSVAEFTGEGACFLEVGRGEAMQVEGSFYADPPSVRLTTPSPEQLEYKEQWEKERVESWFAFA